MKLFAFKSSYYNYDHHFTVAKNQEEAVKNINQQYETNIRLSDYEIITAEIGKIITIPNE